MSAEHRDDLEETVDLPVPDDLEGEQAAPHEAAEAGDAPSPGSDPPDGP